ncbi:NTP transferase domain-containing protein [Poseidonibacter sp.]|uniref:NTP transferase domain-containing protein n=1 Tax=Poseidonibacter sp. TaxID=2321188 RepID=UPI003C714ABC
MKHLNNLQNIPCVILSGGKSLRMGEDKSLLPFGKYSSMSEYIYCKMSNIFKNVYFSSKENKFSFLEDNDIIIDKSDIYSPMIALYTILEKLDNENIFIITVDLPLIHESSINHLLKNALDSNYHVTIAKDSNNNTHPLCGVYNKQILPTIKYLLDENIHKINYLIKKSFNYQEILFEDSTQFLNINTKELYTQAKLLA